jgi:hypothetical protein
VCVTARQTGFACAEQLRLLVDKDNPEAKQVVLVFDDLKTHSPACLYERFTPAEARQIVHKVEWHYTPEHGFCLHIAECELRVLERQYLDWRFTTADARIRCKLLYPVLKEQSEQKAA